MSTRELLKAMRAARGQGAGRARHKYIRRQWDEKSGRFRYFYTPGGSPAANKLGSLKDRLAAQRQSSEARKHETAQAFQPQDTSRKHETSAAKLAENAKGRPSDDPAVAPVLWEHEQRYKDQYFESASVIAMDGSVVIQKDGGTTSVGFNVREMAAMKGCVMTHNHPDPYSFSPEDIQMLLRTGMAEMRACDKMHRHSMVVPPGTTLDVWPHVKVLMEAAFAAMRGAVVGGDISKTQYQRSGWHAVWSVVSAEMGWQYTRDAWSDYEEKHGKT